MKKKILITIGVLFFISISTLTWAISSAFTTVKPTTEKINEGLESTFSKIVRIPKESIPRPSLDFSQITYLWEMETLEKEFIEVRFYYTPAYTSQDNEITAVLEMTETGDPSIFDKVLPALISDQQSLDTARDPLKENLGPNQKAGYSKIELTKNSRGDKTIKIAWIYSKDQLEDQTKENFNKLAKYPPGILETLFVIPNFLMDLVRG